MSECFSRLEGFSTASLCAVPASADCQLVLDRPEFGNRTPCFTTAEYKGGATLGVGKEEAVALTGAEGRAVEASWVLSGNLMFLARMLEPSLERIKFPLNRLSIGAPEEDRKKGRWLMKK